MLTIWINKIKHSTVGSSFSVTFSVAPNELEYLNKLYDYFSSMNWSSFPITADRKTENCSEKPNNCANCKHLKKHNGNLADWVCDRKGSIVTNPYDKECDEMWERKDEPQTEREVE